MLRALHGTALFLAAAGAGTVIMVQARVLLPTAAFMPVLESMVTAGGVTGLALGFCAGALRPRARTPSLRLTGLTALLPALVLGGMGAFPGTLDLGLSLFRALAGRTLSSTPAPPSLPEGLFVVLFLTALPLPFLLALSTSARLDRPGRDSNPGRYGPLLAAAGAGAGLLCLPLLLKVGTGLPAVLQAWALLPLLSAAPFLMGMEGRGRGSESTAATLESEETPKDGPMLQAGLFAFGLTLIVPCLTCWIRWYRSGEDYTTFATTGWMLLGTAAAALPPAAVRKKTRHFLFSPVLVPVLLGAGVLLFQLVPFSPDGHGASAWWIPVFLLLVGAAAGRSLSIGPGEGLGRSVAGLPAGLAAGLLFTVFFFHPALRPMVVLAAGALPFLLLEWPGRRTQSALLRAVLGGAVLGTALWLFRPPVPPDYEDYGNPHAVPGTLLDLTLGAPEEPGRPCAGLRVCGLDPFQASRAPATAERRALLSVLLHPEPKRILVLGPDPGVTPYEAARDPMVETVEWVDPWRLPVSRALNAAKQGQKEERGKEKTPARPLPFPARAFLEARAGRYDLVVIPPDPFEAYRLRNPWTREFYETVVRALRPGGMMCQWIFPHRIPAPELLELLATACGAFPEFNLFTDHPRSCRPALGLVGGTRPLVLSEAHTRNRLSMAGRAELFAAAGLDPTHLGVCYITGKEVLEVRLPLRVFHDGAHPLTVPDPATARENLFRVLRFLQAQRRPLPPGVRWESTASKDEAQRKARAEYLVKAGSMMMEAAMDRCRRRTFDPDLDPAVSSSVDEQEAFRLVRALGAWQPYPYLRDLILQAAARIEAEGKESRALELLESCARRARGDDVFARVRDALAARIRESKDREEGR